MADQTELSSLYKRHSPAVFRRARGLLRNEAEAYEVMQDLFLSLFERPQQFEGKSDITTFLYSATTHACLNRLRNSKNRLRLREEQGDALEFRSETRPLSPEQHLILHTSLAQMPKELAQVAVYRFMDGLTQDETASMMACSRRHINTLCQRLEKWSTENTPNPLQTKQVTHAE